MKSLFVTVGSTSFDELIEEVCSPGIVKILEGLGVIKVTLQIGRGSYEPKETLVLGRNLSLEYYRYKPSISSDINDADIVISHAGAGSILESLRAHKKLIVVINENLMDNHQEELASQLENNKFLISCTVKNLATVLGEIETQEFKTFPDHEPQMFSSYLHSVMGLV